MNNNSMPLITILNMKQPSFILLNFLECQDLENLYESFENVQYGQESDSQYQHLNIIISFIFNKKYMNKVDRTMFYFMYQNQVSQQIDRTSIFNVAQNLPFQAKQVLQTYNTLFNQLKDKCNMSITQVEFFKQMITEPVLPLPVSIRSNIGKYCNSTFQLFVCSKIAKNDLHMIEQTQFQEFKNYLLDNEQKYIKKILIDSGSVSGVSTVQKLRQLYYNPQSFAQKIQLSSAQSMIEGNQLFNFLAFIIRLSKNLIKSIKLQLSSLQSDLYTYFTQFVLRYSIYKGFVLQLQEIFGSVFEQFNEMFEDLVNVNIGKHNKTGCGFSAWKVLMRVFSDQMYHQMNKCLPIYINLVHKLKIIKNNQIYQKTNLCNITNIISQLQDYQGSPVLEYLQNSQILDCLQVFLSDFAQIFIDLSIDQNNVLWCGHSEHSLRSVFYDFENNFIRYENQVLRRLQFTTQIQTIQQTVDNQFKHISRFFGIQPRTIKKLSNELNTCLISIDFQTMDKQITHMNRQFNHFFELQNLLGSKQSINSIITNDSDRQHNDIDLNDLEYFSQISEEEVHQIDF